jgi:minor capsid protein
MGFLETIAVYLEDADLGLTLGTNLFLTEMDDPGMPSACVALYAYAGAPPLQVLDAAGVKYAQPGLHVRCRAADYPTAEAQAEAIWLALSAVANQTIDGTWVLGVVPQQSPFSLGPDALGRPVLVSNFICTYAVPS